jgi:hypothetical protein
MDAKALAAAVAVTLLAPGRAPAAARQDAPPTPPALTAVPAEDAGPPTVLLLGNGHVFQGEIREDDSGYYLRHKIGVKHFARRNVAGVFRSLDEAYRYQLARVPRNDPDERMKLALWCLEQKLHDQARQELETVLALSPENGRAKAMMFHLQARRADAVDPEVARAGAIAEPESPAGAPRELSPSALDQLREAQRSLAPAGPPIIFDLPPPLAVRRYQEFARFVHPELQNHCARCHDAESHTGAFRLYRTRTRRDLSNDLIGQANLDATLQLVDPNDLARSKLLSAAALTHPPDGRPVLGGPNHPSYRVLAAWVASLKDTTARPAAPSTAGNVVPARYEMPEAAATPPPVEGFAAGRNPGAAASRPPGPSRPPTPLDSLAGAPVSAPPRVVGGGAVQGTVTSPAVPGDVHFPEPSELPRVPTTRGAGLPPVATPTPIKTENLAEPAPEPAGDRAPASAAPPGPPGPTTMPDGSPAIRLPSGELVPFVSGDALKKTPAEGEDDPAKKAVKAGERKARIDRAALQKFMQQRTAK